MSSCAELFLTPSSSIGFRVWSQVTGGVLMWEMPVVLDDTIQYNTHIIVAAKLVRSSVILCDKGLSRSEVPDTCEAQGYGMQLCRLSRQYE